MLEVNDPEFTATLLKGTLLKQMIRPISKVPYTLLH